MATMLDVVADEGTVTHPSEIAAAGLLQGMPAAVPFSFGQIVSFLITSDNYLSAHVQEVLLAVYGGPAFLPLINSIIQMGHSPGMGLSSPTLGPMEFGGITRRCPYLGMRLPPLGRCQSRWPSCL